ncbi:hypothetical protein [Metabacillus litoralis]|uniref:hypothetical protein n=1 Tax=Metabacillus litoralis TaxID=152268 RepID=UPI00203E5188|nr:hypothetical protein [Metabacillus litoralis]MCM3409263.1 hypothetical protein [Metabacillus litoralis]
MKHLLLIKSFMVLLISLSGLQLVSMSTIYHHPTNQGKIIAVENEATAGVLIVEEDQKHFDLFRSVDTAYIVLIIALAMFLFGQLLTHRQQLKPFLYAVYYQSSYFLKNHLLKPTLLA